ncbi:hypothetical protein Tco_1247364 [Tanacetum coccineum]
MDITRAEQIALDDALVAPANRPKIGKSNLRLSSDLKFIEATLQVVYDVLKLTPFYKAFQIIADVLEIYMQEFWATATVHHHSIYFKMNDKKHVVNLEYFREMLQICPKLPGQQFEEPSFEEEILTFLRDLGHTGEIKVIIDVNVNKLHQPWRLFVVVISKCLSDYAYLLWEDFVYQVENKNEKRSNEMYYPRFTKVIVNFFMTKDSSIPRRNKVNWHFSRDDPMFTTIKVVSRHEDTQLYGAIFPDELTNKAIKDSESYKEYYAIASGAEPLKTKASVKKKQAASNTTKNPSTAKSKRLKTLAKAAKPAKKKQPAKTSKDKSLTVLSEVALTEAEQMKLAIERSKTQTHSSHASGSGADEGTGVIPGVLDVPTYNSDDEQISWKSSSDEDNDAKSENDDDDDDVDNQDDDGQEYDVQDDDNEQTNSDNDGDDFVHPKFSIHDEEDNEEDSFDPRVQKPSHVESSDDEDSDEEIQGANVKGEELDEEETNEEDKANELYRDMNGNLEGRDTEMTDAPRTINTGIDSIFNLNTESTSLVDVPVTTIAELPLLSATILPPPPTPLITHLQQTPVPTPATVSSSSLQDLPNFGSLFRFDHRLKTLETKFSEFKQTNQFAAAVSSIHGIVDTDEAQAKNADFINKLDDNIKKIIKDQVKEQVKAISKIWLKIEKIVNEQLEAEVLTRLSNKSKTSHAVAANLSELELKKILIDKMKSNKSIHRSDKQKNLYKALVDAYESDKLILDTTPKEKTSKITGKSTEGSKSHHNSADKSAQAEEPMHTAKDLEEPAHQEFVTGDSKGKPDEETSQHPDWFQKPVKPPTPDHDWNKAFPAAHGPVQPWLSTLAQKEDTHE